MNKQKQLPNVKLQKTSVIFMQLGLILALFSVHLIIEHESFYKIAPLDTGVALNDPDDEATIKEFVIEKPKPQKKSTAKKVVKVIPKKQPKPTNVFETVKDEDKRVETAVLKSSDTDEKQEVKITADDIPEVVDTEVVDDDIPFILIEKAPEYPGCKGSDLEKKQCFKEQITKFVQRKFNVELAQELGLSAGKKQISVQFIIDKQGDIIDIKARAPHPRLKKEAMRVIKLLPKMKPAKQGKNFAKVRFNLPIKFVVED